MKLIRSKDNAFFKFVKRLSHSSRARKTHRQTILEGPHLIEEWVRHIHQPLTLCVSEEAIEHAEIKALLTNISQEELIVFSPGLFNELSPVEHSVGILGIITALPDKPFKGFNHEADAVWLDDVQDPGNIGTILRTASAAGIQQILVTKGTDRLWSPKALRAGMGAHFTLSFWDASLWINHRIGTERIIGTQLDASQSLYDTNLINPIIWVVGNEGQGISPLTQSYLTESIFIPMAPHTESLNVAISSAVCLFEQFRQRKTFKK